MGTEFKDTMTKEGVIREECYVAQVACYFNCTTVMILLYFKYTIIMLPPLSHKYSRCTLNANKIRELPPGVSPQLLMPQAIEDSLDGPIKIANLLHQWLRYYLKLIFSSNTLLNA